MNRLYLMILISLSGVQYTNGQENQYSDMVKEAWKFYQNKEYGQSGQKYVEAFTSLESQNTLPDNHEQHRFNAACAWSLANRSNDAFIQLFKIAKEGYSDYESLKSDADLNKIHDDIRWKEVVKIVADNYELIRPLSKAELITIFEKYQKSQDIVFKSGSTVGDVDTLYAFYTDDFEYNHPKYGGIYTRESLYNNTVKFLKAGRYKDGKKRNTLNRIVGLDAIVIEQQYEGKSETTMTLFKFRKDKILYRRILVGPFRSILFEAW